MFAIVKPGPKKFSWEYLGCCIQREGHYHSSHPDAVFVKLTAEEYVMHMNHSQSTVNDFMLVVRPNDESFFKRRVHVNTMQDFVVGFAYEDVDVLITTTRSQVRVHINNPELLDDPQFEVSIYGVTQSDPLEPLFNIKTQEQDHTVDFAAATSDKIVVWVVAPIEGIKYGVRNVSTLD